MLRANRSIFSALATIAMVASCLSPAAGKEPSHNQPAGQEPGAKNNASPQRLNPLTREASRVAEELKKKLPPESEARMMLDAILKGERMGPDDGWFRVAKSKTRFGWKYVARTFDADGDAKVTAKEFQGPAGDFHRLDRNHDGRLTMEDFNFSDHALARTPGLMMFYMADRDGDGHVTQQEFTDLFHSIDNGKRGFLSLNDLKDVFTPPAAGGRRGRSGGPSQSTLILGLARQEIGSLQPGPDVNDKAPDFTLPFVDRTGKVTLSKEIGVKPIVLVFGNFTCGPFRSQSGNIHKLYERYKNRAKFFMVYVREAHPVGGWHMESNKRLGVNISQPTTEMERRKVARTCQRTLSFEMPFLVDSVKDTVGAPYSGMPGRLYVIDGRGKVAFKSGRGPFGFKPNECEQSLILLLNQQAARTAPQGR